VYFYLTLPANEITVTLVLPKIHYNRMRTIITALLLFITTIAFSQNAGNTWYFGNGAGVSFNSTPPSGLSNGALFTGEGCSSYSDPTTGQILVYTDGSTVWGKNHVAMPSSVSNPLTGNSSSTQSGVIIPMPGDPNKVYIFTTPAQLGFSGSSAMCYSIVDLTLNGGNGDVITTNVPLIDSATEKIASIASCNGLEFWVVGHKWNCDTFYAFKITAAGVSAPVKSKVGIVQQDAGSGNFSESIGYLKFSSDGKKLGSVCYVNLNTAEIFDFDINTGVISNPTTDFIGFDPNNSVDGPYGCTFSPDNSRFYVGVFGVVNSKVYQYDMTAGSSAAIVASRTTVYNQPNPIGGMGALQNGPDGILYASLYGNGDLSAFLSPNSLGMACNFQSAVVPLTAGTTCTFGLPVIVENFLTNVSTPFNTSVNKDICIGDTVTAVQPAVLNFTINPSNTCSVSSDSLTVRFFPLTTTTYTIVISNACSASDTTLFTVNVIPDPTPDFYFNPPHPDLSNGTISLMNTSINGSTYIWYDDLTSTNIGSTFNLTLPNPGLGSHCYKLEAFNSLGCSASTVKCVTVDDTLKTVIVVPNVFSPNSDGLNDIIRVLGENIEMYEFLIYNRFGQQVYRTTDITEGWNGRYKGKDCELGTYYFMVYYFDTKGRPEILKGDILLLR
jgi:gliding motility-associated-like protein